MTDDKHGVAQNPELTHSPALDSDAMREALEACRPEIERQRDRCNSDQEVTPYQALLDQIDAALAPQPGPIRNDMRALFRAVDDQDWAFLLTSISDGGRGRFWKEILTDVRGALSAGPIAAPSPALDPATVEALRPHLIDNDLGEITVTLNDKELRGWSYRDDTERRTKMFAAREYIEGWYDGREAR